MLIFRKIFREFVRKEVGRIYIKLKESWGYWDWMGKERKEERGEEGD